MARNLTILYENFADAAAYAGGSWVAGLPVSNLATPYLAEVARSTTVDAASTKFTVTLPRVDEIGGIVIGPCTVTTEASVRIRSYLAADMVTLVDDSGLIGVPLTITQSEALEWEGSLYWEGAPSEFDDLEKGATFFHVPAAAFSAGFILVEIFDPSNADEYIDVSRFFAGRAWTAAYNYDASDNALDFETLTDEEESRSGVKFFNPRAMRRVFGFSFAYLPAEPSFRDIYRIATRSGRHNQVVVLPKPDDPTSLQRESFIGTLRQMPSLRRRKGAWISTSFQIEETL